MAIATSTGQAQPVRTSDFGAAALLVAEGCRLISIDPTDDPRRQEFVLSGEPELVRRLITEYRQGIAVVSVDAFLAAQRSLKDRLFRAERLR